MLTRRIVGIELWPFFEAAEGPAVAELESLSDRAAGIVAVTLVENRLTSGILNQLRDDDDAIVGDLCGNNGPLASLSSKIVMAYALGLLSKRGRQDLDLLRKIRNEFAHNLSHSSFETEAIKNRCMALKTVDQSVVFSDEGTIPSGGLVLPGTDPSVLRDPRQRFFLAVQTFIGATMVTSPRRPKPRIWI